MLPLELWAASAALQHVGGVLIGVLTSVARGYLDPVVVGGFGNVVSYLALIAVLFVRPRGLFGQPAAERV